MSQISNLHKKEGGLSLVAESVLKGLYQVISVGVTSKVNIRYISTFLSPPAEGCAFYPPRLVHISSPHEHRGIT